MLPTSSRADARARGCRSARVTRPGTVRASTRRRGARRLPMRCRGALRSNGYRRSMQLAVHASGGGSRTAILIHGIMSDSRAWHRVTAELESRGFRVLAVDLAGPRPQPAVAPVLAGRVGRRRRRDARAAARPRARRRHGPFARRPRREHRRRSPRAARGHLHRPRVLVPDGHPRLGVQGVLRDRTPASPLSARADEPEVERRPTSTSSSRRFATGTSARSSASPTPGRSCRRPDSSRPRSSCSPRRACSSPRRWPRSCAARG